MVKFNNRLVDFPLEGLNLRELMADDDVDVNENSQSQVPPSILEDDAFWDALESAAVNQVADEGVVPNMH